MRLNLIALAILAAACGNGQPQKPTTDPNAYQDATDKSSCIGAPSPQSSILGVWRQRSVDGNGDEMDTTTTISQSTGTTYYRLCKWGGYSLDVTLQVASNIYGNQYILSSGGPLTTNGTDPNGVARSCPLQVSPTTFTFSYVGQCILLQDQNGGQGYLVR